LGKQTHRLPNNRINAITDVGQMKRAQPTALNFKNAQLVRLLEHFWLELHAKWRSTTAR
jgi:hypothetical protein